MNIIEILAIEDFEKVLTILTGYNPKVIQEKAKNWERYRGKHDILNDPQRAARTVGDDPKTNRVVTPTKEVIEYEKRIVNSAVTFLFGEPVTLMVKDDKDNDSFNLIKDIWKRNKINYFDKKLARSLFVECSVAELWHIPAKEPDKDARIRVTLLSEDNGYKIYPHFDESGDMDAFTVTYEIMGPEAKPVETARIWTAEKIITARKENTTWDVDDTDNMLKMIPIVYYEQEAPEWDSVKTQIKRSDYLVSNFADTNDYFGSPVLQVKGIVKNLPKKEQMGKVFQVDPEQDESGHVYYPGGVEYVTWESAPESTKIEYNMLKDIIFGMTSTPDLSFSNVKGIENPSGISLRLMFSDALFKAKDKQEIFGPAMERRLSIVKNILGITDVAKTETVSNLDIEIVFNDVLPQDVEALIKSLSVARGGEAIMSQESAVKRNPLVLDAETDLENLKEERAAENLVGESFNLD